MPLLVIDTDAHVEENAATWQHLAPAFRDRGPVALTLERDPYLGNANAHWLVDGKLVYRARGRGANMSLTPPTSIGAHAKPYSIGSQDLSDVPARLRDMDAQGVDVQVLFPTVFNRPLADDPRLETALHRAYNTWLAEAVRPAAERLKWVAVMPLQEPAEAVAEVRRAKELGAVGALVYPLMGGRHLDDEAFAPFYAELCRLELPLCIHVGWYLPALTDLYTDQYRALVSSICLPMLDAFLSLAGGDVLARHPDLRVGFFESGATWLLYWVERMDHYYDANGGLGWPRPPRRPSDYLAERRLFFTFEPEERWLPQVIALLGDDVLLLSTDMPHSEGRERAVDTIATRSDLSESSKRKIFADNALRFFQLSGVPAGAGR